MLLAKRNISRTVCRSFSRVISSVLLSCFMFIIYILLSFSACYDCYSDGYDCYLFIGVLLSLCLSIFLALSLSFNFCFALLRSVRWTPQTYRPTLGCSGLYV